MALETSKGKAASSIAETSSKKEYPVQPFKDKDFSLNFYRLMVRSRVLEERIIKMAKSGEGFFWIGGPGEEAFNIALGLQVNKGQGLKHDMLHLHYRNNGVLMAMGQPMIDVIRQMRSVKTDSSTGGRNFVSHPAVKAWNVFPVTSTIETQFSVAPGTGLAQRRARLQGKESGITIVVGGDAGTSEGDFATCLVWCNRPHAELPVLMIVTNNHFGISTPAESQHGEKNIADRGRPFGMRVAVADGNTPDKAWSAIEDSIDYVRSTGKPYLLELHVSRLYGHSSSSGANRIKDEFCPVDAFGKKLVKQSWIAEKDLEVIWQEARAEATSALEKVRGEELPDASSVYDHSFANNERAGLPGKPFGSDI